MEPLREADLRRGMRLLQEVSAAAGDVATFARRGIEELVRLAPSEMTTLSVCDLAAGRRSIAGARGNDLSAADRAAFDRHFHEHPLVRYHGERRGSEVHRISDSVPLERFRRTALYNEYYRSIRIDHALALPVHVDASLLVSFVFNRTRRDFSDRERALLELLRPALGNLYRHARALELARSPARLLEARVAGLPLTPRERELVLWLARGKTDREIAALLGISPRTVQKHLQRTYAKLGVETRTAAVMRALAHEVQR